MSVHGFGQRDRQPVLDLTQADFEGLEVVRYVPKA